MRAAGWRRRGSPCSSETLNRVLLWSEIEFCEYNEMILWRVGGVLFAIEIL